MTLLQGPKDPVLPTLMLLPVIFWEIKASCFLAAHLLKAKVPKSFPSKVQFFYLETIGVS